MNRRDFLAFLGISTTSTVVLSSFPATGKNIALATNNPMGFHPVKIPMPLEVDDMAKSKQMEIYQTYEVKDDLMLPSGFTYQIIGAWGDKIGDSRFGYNNDYLSFIPTGYNEGLLTINFEYISGKTWMETYPLVLGETLPFAEVKAKVTEGKINAFALAENDPLKMQIKEISKEGLVDQGIGVISLRRNNDGTWSRTYQTTDRRITGISGLEDGRYLQTTGPAIAVFNKKNKQGYDDNLGTKIIGTFQNCAGGTTPWGTVLSAEENFQDQVPEAVMADGSSLDPSQRPFVIDDKTVDGRANVFGLAGNKYGWMVEVDPANPNDYGTKHTWLGRFRHEAVACRAVSGKQLAVYSGCDRRGGHLYKFVSTAKIREPKNKANSGLLSDGMLYGAKFNPDGTGEWIALNPNTRVNPVLPSQVAGKKGQGMVTLPNPVRTQGGVVEFTNDAEVIAYKQKFPTLADLYIGDSQEEKQGAILIDAHFAGNAVGISCTARPEDTEVSADGKLYIAFTSGSPGSDGGPDRNVFQGPSGEETYEFGWIMALKEDGNDPEAMTFSWKMMAMGGEPADGYDCHGFSNPDNLAIDSKGNLWMVTDMSTSKHNQAVNNREVSQTQLLGIYGNNSTWCIPTSGANAGKAYPFAIGPMESETCGLNFTPDEKTLFLAIQHPGERGGMREEMAMETNEFMLKTTEGETFMQKRAIPVGSNWPSKLANQPPKPGVVAVFRQDGQPITG